MAERELGRLKQIVIAQLDAESEEAEDIGKALPST